ncbi:protein arginine N-methyltransferase PRMT10 [Sesamum angolense]|uniref:Protein arginine N-methyltransferase PRMT10 n=1 Tax=Sesamum angolense TaxID=2727404 RepID=A0AAE1WE48_9LAMI|nr:protein arginine N-methyltransferase PRMT10 [Sesamum angolense]
MNARTGLQTYRFDDITVQSTQVRTMGSTAASGVVDKGVDFANYFCTYGFLYHQKEMLSDRVRMDAYYNAIFENKHHFQGKTVLDVGTGSGILAIWSAQAGARKVYAVEATKMAEHALELVKANKLQNVVEVIEGSMEDVTLPEKVDVIISEWMGYFLLRESMLDSVICARDRWLKPNGVMRPLKYKGRPHNYRKHNSEAGIVHLLMARHCAKRKPSAIFRKLRWALSWRRKGALLRVAPSASVWVKLIFFKDAVVVEGGYRGGLHVRRLRRARVPAAAAVAAYS